MQTGEGGQGLLVAVLLSNEPGFGKTQVILSQTRKYNDVSSLRLVSCMYIFQLAPCLDQFIKSVNLPVMSNISGFMLDIGKTKRDLSLW